MTLIPGENFHDKINTVSVVAPRWIGPQLEALLSAEKMITVKLNSTTDNPIVDIQGHFLAMS